MVASPNVAGSTSDELLGVAAIASNDIWAVGEYDSSNMQQTLVEHWNGKAWKIVSSPNIATLANSVELLSVTRRFPVTARECWH